MDSFGGAQAPPFATGKKALHRVNPEFDEVLGRNRTRGLKRGSRRADINQESFGIEGVKA